jgi:FkbM family methyltransferase
MKLTKWMSRLLMYPYSKWSLAKARNSILNSEQFGEKKELEIINILIQKIKEIPIQKRPYIFFDIGSNVGIYTTFFKSLNFDVLAIEANKSLAFKLKSEHVFSRVSVINAVVGAETNSVIFYENYNHGISSIMRPENFEIKKTYILNNVCLDDYSYLAPMFIKVDIEGCEKKAIQESIKILTYIKPIWLLEVDRREINYFIQFFIKHDYKPSVYFYLNKCFKFKELNIMERNLIENNSPERTNILFVPPWLDDFEIEDSESSNNN